METRTTVQEYKAPRPGVRRLAALLGFAIVVALLVVVPAPRASGVTYTFLVNSLSHQGDDVAPGDGVCLTATGVCTLRAALQEANALHFPDVAVIAPAEDVDATTPGVQTSGTIVGSGTGAANFMFVGALTPLGDDGAYFMATGGVVMDFQNRLGIASLNDLNGATAVFVNGPDVSIRNFSNIKSNETAFVFGSNSDRATVEYGTCTDPGGISLERCFWLGTGADDVTIRHVDIGSTSSAGGSAIRVADTASVTGLTLDQIRMYDPDTGAYSGLQMQGTATLTRLTITGSTFEGFQPGTYPVDLRGATLSNATISGNRFTRINNGAALPTVWINRPGTNNVIADNTFDNTAADASGYGVYFSSLELGATTTSGWIVQDNYVDGRRLSSVFVGTGSGILPVVRNTFGPLSYGGGAVANETDSTAVVYNETTLANQKINTWYPTALAYDGTACTLDVTVTPPVVAPIPVVAVTIDVYYTTSDTAEIYLGSESGLVAAGTVTVPYSLGPGNIRVQTTAANGATSQYSRTIPQTQADLCGPRVTIDQAAGQADPTSTRDVHFTAEFSETVTANLLPSAVGTTGSTAPGTTVTHVTRLSGSAFDITAQANGTGTIVLTLPAGAIVDPEGNPSLASTSTDNEVSYVSPLSVAPNAVTVEEGGPPQTYTVTTTLPAVAAITVTPAVADPAWVTATPTPLVIASTAPSGTVSVAAVDDSLVNGTRTTSISHTVSSPDPDFDGLLLEPVAVQVLDDDQPDAAASSVATTVGTRVADGTDAHLATATIRSAEGAPLAGVLVTFQISGGATLGASTCTTGAAGTCSVPITSTVPGTSTVSAFIGGTQQLTGTPATVEFVVGAPSTTTSTIAASALTLPADGVSTSQIVVTLRDAFGNPVGTGGANVDIQSDSGTISDLTDNGDGTYTATLTAETAVGTSTVTYTLDGVVGDDSVTINFVVGEPSASTSTIEADLPSIPADGFSTTGILVTLFDGYGNPVASSTAAVGITPSLGTLGAVNNLGEGRYGATLTASATAGTSILRFTVDGVLAPSTATVQFVAGEPSVFASTIAASPTAIVADGASQSAVTVTVRDDEGNPVGTGGPAIEIRTSNGTIGETVDNGDGTYTAVLTSAATPGTATVSFTLDGIEALATATVEFLAGTPDAASSLIVAAPATIAANGISTSTVTVTVRDAQGRVLTGGGADVAILSSATPISDDTDNGNGTYTATLTSPLTVGQTTLTFTVGGVLSPNTATVTFIAGPPAAATSTIEADPPTATADGVDSSTVTVTLRDANGNPVTSGGATVELSSTIGGFGSVTDNGGGTYTGYLSSTTAGTATVSFTVDGESGTETATVEFVAGSADPATSTIEAVPTTVVADGDRASTLTVTLLDATGNPVTSGAVVAFDTTVGALATPVDNGGGTWVTTLTSVVSGTATVTFTVNGVEAADTATVLFIAGPASPDTSTIEADPGFLPADGASTSTVTVTLLDLNGNPVGQGASTVTMFTSAGSLGPVTSGAGGTYTAVFTAPTSTTPPSATIGFTVDGAEAANTATVAFAAGVPSAAASEIEATPGTATADGVDPSTVTVTLRDANGNLVTDAGPVVTVTTTRGFLTTVDDNGDGTYTATLTSTEAGPATVGFTVENGGTGPTTTVTFLPGEADATQSQIAATPTQIAADGVSTSAVVVTLRDTNGNDLTEGGNDVELATTGGTLGDVTDNDDGTYTALLTAPTTPGAATVSFTVDGAAAVETAIVTFVETVPSPTTSSIDVDPATIGSDGVDPSTVTVTLRDANGIPLTHGGNAVTMTTTVGTLSAVEDNGNGTYTATLRSTVAGVATLGFAVGGTPAPDTATVNVLDTTPPDAPVITAPANGATVPADVAVSGTGEPGATVTVTANGAATCTATVTGAGTWSCTPASPLVAGTTALVALQTDAAGNESAVSPTVTVTVDATAPPAPTPDATNGARVVGAAEPGTTVTIRGEDGTVLCVTTAGDDGRFECVPDEPIPTGTLLFLTATDVAGNESPAATVRVGGASVTLALALALPGQVQTANGVGFLPGESVAGLLESTPVDLGTRVADATGAVTFTVTLPIDIAAGTHRVTLTGAESGAVFAEFRVEAVAGPGAPGPGGPGAPGPTTPGTPGPGAPDPATPGGPGDVLSSTGIAGMPAVTGMALLLLLVGGLLARAGRRVP